MSNQQHSFTGNLTRDPVVRQAGESKVASFSVAVNGRKPEDTVFFECETWSPRAEIVGNPEWFKKGTPISVNDAEVINDTWDDKKTGEKRSRHKYRVLRLSFVNVGNKPGEVSTTTEDNSSAPVPKAANKRPARPPVNTNTNIDDDDSEIPF